MDPVVLMILGGGVILAAVASLFSMFDENRDGRNPLVESRISDETRDTIAGGIDRFYDAFPSWFKEQKK